VAEGWAVKLVVGPLLLMLREDSELPWWLGVSLSPELPNNSK